jgi:hypothetical protein
MKYGLLIVACLAVALFCLIYPVYVIQPFRPQGPRELQVALAVIRFRAIPVLLCAAGAIFAAVGFWRLRGQLWLRLVAGLGALLVLASAALSRVNVYELMFHPMDRPRFAAAADTKLDGDEKVIAVALGGAARAYPIRIISYHHIVNDVVGAVPIVATY